MSLEIYLQYLTLSHRTNCNMFKTDSFLIKFKLNFKINLYVKILQTTSHIDVKKCGKGKKKKNGYIFRLLTSTAKYHPELFFPIGE